MPGETQRISLPDAEISFSPVFYDAKRAARFFNELQRELCWSQQTIQLFGKRHLVPRLTAFYGDARLSYTYSAIRANALPWTPLLHHIKSAIERATQEKFNSVLANLYRNGEDSNGWHADDEPELGEKPVIASLSLGAARDFQFKHRKLPQHKYSRELGTGSLLVMAGDMQAHWLHHLPKRRRVTEPRINLTFRLIQQ